MQECIRCKSNSVCPLVPTPHLAQNEKCMTPLGTAMVLVSLRDPTTCIHTLAEHGDVPHLGDGKISTWRET